MNEIDKNAYLFFYFQEGIFLLFLRGGFPKIRFMTFSPQNPNKE